MKNNADSDLEDRLDPLEPPYRSRAETQIGRQLDQYGVLFYYRQPRLIMTEDRYEIWHPAFTLPYYNSLVIEYAGPLDTPQQRIDLARRQQVYQDNGIEAVFLSEVLRSFLPPARTEGTRGGEGGSKYDDLKPYGSHT